jgi:hypothetical protein
MSVNHLGFLQHIGSIKNHQIIGLERCKVSNHNDETQSLDYLKRLSIQGYRIASFSPRRLEQLHRTG